MSRARTVVESSRALPLVSITVAQASGALEDPAGQEGLSRLSARLMRRTGAGLAPHILDTRIDSLGGAMGADIGHSVVSFHGTVIARSLEPFVDLLVDVLARPGLSGEELARLKRESESELIEVRDNDRALARRWFRRRMFPDHPYGRPVSGTIASLSSVGQSDVKRHYQRTCVANNLLFSFAGDITAEQAEHVAERVRGALPPGARVPDATPEPSAVPGRRLVFVDKPERTQTQILIGGLGTHPADADHIPLTLANYVFGGTFTARMTRAIRSERGWSYGAYSSLPYDRQRQPFSMWTFPKLSDAAPCIKLELEMLEEWLDKGITDAELSWVKSYLSRSHAFSIDTASKRAGLAMDELLYGLPEGYHDKYVERVQAVTVAQANSALRERLSKQNLLVVVVGTAAEIQKDVEAAIPGLGDVEVIPFDTDG